MMQAAAAAAVCGGSPVLPSSTVDPATNDAPLEFAARIKTTVAPEGLGRPVGASFGSFAAGLAESAAGLPSLAGLMGSPTPWGVPPFIGLPGDPALMGVVSSYGQCPQFSFLGPPPEIGPGMLPASVINANAPMKELLRFPNCVLYPPKPNMPPPATRERPPGCRTVFVGGLPESATEELVREVFQHCGTITTVRMSKKNFCHIRFENEEQVDRAIALSGYRLKIRDQEEAVSQQQAVGRLHVDFAQARDDQYEWECRQRALQRELRHRERLDRERLRPPSPPPIVHYSDHEAQQLTERLKGDESFQKAVQTLTVWLDRGECSKRNAGHFYSMLQTANGHIRRLLQEKKDHQEALDRARLLFAQRLQGILVQLGQIEKVFAVASHQKVWDHFTKAQRKNIDAWRKQSEEIKSAHLADVLDKRQEDEMDLSDEDEPPPSKMAKTSENGSDGDGGGCGSGAEDEAGTSARLALQEECDSLRCQLEAYRNEAQLLKAEQEQRDQQLRLLQQALQGLQQQRARDFHEMDRLRSSQSNSAPSPEREQCSASSGSRNEVSSSTQVAGIRITEKDAKLIGLVSMFLHLHPDGASLDYLWSYVHTREPTLQPCDVEVLLSKFPALFPLEVTGVGATLERRWKFGGFAPSL
ncbi:ecto-NOX disulfide-thiol exchanger 2 [Haemaphysalis longicornis]